jgi:hypothetical protein
MILVDLQSEKFGAPHGIGIDPHESSRWVPATAALAGGFGLNAGIRTSPPENGQTVERVT